MHATRRDFLAAAAGSAAALALTPYAAYARLGRAGAPLRILVLGGTGFLGPHCIEACLARGHHVTTFNRGKTEKRTGHTFEDQANVTKLHGNRDPEKAAEETEPEGPDNPKGLAQLAEGEWDAVIDTSGYYPRIVRASAELLAPRVGQYVFISSLSAYGDNSTPGDDETAAVGTMEDPTVENMGDQFQNYGPLKALCEQAAEAAFPGRTTNVRPGYIVGPGDPTDRFTYWPLRIARGGEVLAPGAATDPVMWIDVRDLAEWIVLAIEQKHVGFFNAIGPEGGSTMGAMLDACKKASEQDPALTWVPAEFLESQQVSLPIWVPAEGEYAGFHTRSNAKAVAAGMTFRDPVLTCRDTLDWFPKELERRIRVTGEMMAEAEKAGKPAPQMGDPTQLRAGIPPEREAEVLEAWRKQQG
ncbi:MAG TPA: NAD-dependent epimerase/dehydratase family protein [Phycisphaerales bacterium]|nr:NAD-dependent epimerase/dehydratase family protein [Phycisphaerales bacterium]